MEQRCLFVHGINQLFYGVGDYQAGKLESASIISAGVLCLRASAAVAY